jgi:hypothetical protein
MDEVAGPHCQCVVRIFCNTQQRRWCGKLRDVRLLPYHLTCVAIGIPTCECDIHRNWYPSASEYLPGPEASICDLYTS